MSEIKQPQLESCGCFVIIKRIQSIFSALCFSWMVMLIEKDIPEACRYRYCFIRFEWDLHKKNASHKPASMSYNCIYTTPSPQTPNPKLFYATSTLSTIYFMEIAK